MAGIWHTYFNCTSAGTTTASFYYTVYGSCPNDFQSLNRFYEYTGDISYEWHYSGNPSKDWYGESGSVDLEGLSSGSSYTSLSTVEVYMYCKRRIYAWSDETEGFDTFLESEWAYVDSTTVALNSAFYTKPGSFTAYDSLSAETIIESSDGLTAEKVGKWCDHCNKYHRWKNQQASSAGDTCRVSAGSWITAEWYNKCANLCGAPQIDATNPPLISADLIKALANFSA